MEKMTRNEAIGIVKKDLEEHHEFGSLFQFFVSLIASEIEQGTELDVYKSHDLAIECVKTLAL